MLSPFCWGHIYINPTHSLWCLTPPPTGRKVTFGPIFKWICIPTMTKTPKNVKEFQQIKNSPCNVGLIWYIVPKGWVYMCSLQRNICLVSCVRCDEHFCFLVSICLSLVRIYICCGELQMKTNGLEYNWHVTLLDAFLPALPPPWSRGPQPGKLRRTWRRLKYLLRQIKMKNIQFQFYFILLDFLRPL